MLKKRISKTRGSRDLLTHNTGSIYFPFIIRADVLYKENLSKILARQNVILRASK